MTDQRSKGKQSNSREDRLRAALRANLGRRKAQARARADQENNQAEEASTDTGITEEDS